jgi:non-heme chloroperoxidase
MTAEIWAPQIEYFSNRYKVLALDARSQGESDKPNDGNYPERRAQDLKEFVGHCQGDVVLVGWSTGVTELLNYANPFGTNNVRAFILVDGFVQLDSNWRTFHWSLIKQIQEDRPAQRAQFARWMYKKSQPESYLQRITAVSLRTPTNTAIALMANLIRQEDWRSMLAKIDKPVFYAVRLDFRDQTEILRATLPSARVEVFEDAGHALFIDDSERFNNSLQSFLNTVWAATPH